MKREIWILLLICAITHFFFTNTYGTNFNNETNLLPDGSDKASYIETAINEKDEIYSERYGNSTALNNASTISMNASVDGSLLINGTVYIDRNGNSILDQGEIGLAGWTVKLLYNGSEIARFRTDRFGQYLFAGLKPGVYTVAEELQNGWNHTHADDGEQVIILQEMDAHGVNFGNVIIREFISNTTTLMYIKAEELKEMKMSRENLYSANLSPTIESKLKSAAQGQSFDLLNYLPMIASERDQGWCGNCWVWAGTGLMEVDNSVNNGIDDERLSIQYFSSNYFDGQGCDFDCCGGYLDTFAEAYNSVLKKAVPWSNDNAEFVDVNRCCSDGCSVCPPSGCDASIDHTSIPASEIAVEPNYAINSVAFSPIFTSGIPKEDAILAVKNVLLQNRAVMFSFVQSTSSDFPNHWMFNSESDIWTPDQTQCGNYLNTCDLWGHSVLCVGFDDIDPTNRYWIMVNSWGITENRPNGIFLVSMDMDYNCKFNGEDIFYFDTLDINWNKPPGTPSNPSGLAFGLPARAYSFSTSSVDPEMDGVKYIFDWGDGSTTTTSLIESGATVTADHSWIAAGDYLVKAVAVDSRGANSSWSGEFEISILPGLSPDQIGVFRNGPWYLDYNGNRAWDPASGDVSFWFGTGGDLPLAGDWNGDGWGEIGVFRNGPWYLDYNGNQLWDPASGDVSFWFGAGGDLPLAGDWNGDGRDEIGVFRNGPWYLDDNGNQLWDPASGDVSFWFGTLGDVPIAGDWNGDGWDEIGVFRNGPWYLDFNGNRIWDPASGDVSFWFGTGGDLPLAGDWNGDGRDEIGVFRNGPWYLDYNGNQLWDLASGDISFWFGAGNDLPLAGRWGLQPIPNF